MQQKLKYRKILFSARSRNICNIPNKISLILPNKSCKIPNLWEENKILLWFSVGTCDEKNSIVVSAKLYTAAYFLYMLYSWLTYWYGIRTPIIDFLKAKCTYSGETIYLYIKSNPGLDGLVALEGVHPTDIGKDIWRINHVFFFLHYHLCKWGI